MRDYSCYFLNQNGRIVDATILHCQSDDEVAAVCTMWLADRPSHHHAQVWDGGRRVA